MSLTDTVVEEVCYRYASNLKRNGCNKKWENERDEKEQRIKERGQFDRCRYKILEERERKTDRQVDKGKRGKRQKDR